MALSGAAAATLDCALLIHAHCRRFCRVRVELSLLGNASIQLLTRQLMRRLNDHPGDLDCMQVAITIGSALLCCRAGNSPTRLNLIPVTLFADEEGF